MATARAGRARRPMIEPHTFPRWSTRPLRPEGGGGN